MPTVSTCRSSLNALIVPLYLLFFSFPYAVFSQSAPEPTTLEIKKPVQRSIAGGQKHVYRIDLADGDFVLFTLDQSDVDVIIRYLNQEGQLVAEFDSESRLRGTEKAEGVALKKGTFRIEVEPRYKDAPAGRYQIEWLEKRPATEDDKFLQQARILLRDQRALEREGKYKESLALAERVLEIRERILGPDDVEVGIASTRVGIQHFFLGDGAKADAFNRRALAIYEARLGPDHLLVGEATNNLGVYARVRGELLEAEKMFLRVVAIKERALGPDHLSIATTLNNLGILYRRRGDHINAEATYERALAIRERALGADHTDVAGVLQNFAALRFYVGDYEAAVAMDERGLAIREKNLGPDHPLVAQSLNGLASTYLELGKLDKAEQLVRRALQIYEKRLGPKSLNVARALAVLGQIHVARDDLPNAKAALERAIRISEKSAGDDPDDFAGLLLQLGTVFTLQHDYANAESYLRRGREITEKVSEPDSHYVGRACTALAEMYALKGDVELALKHQQCAARVYERSIELNLSVGPEHQKLSYMKLISDDLNQTIALSAGPAKDNPNARMLAATELIKRKGRVLDATAASLAALRQRLNPEDQRLFDDLGDVNRDLAENILNPPSAISRDAYAKLIGDLQSKKERMEKDISTRTRGFYVQAQPVTLERMQAMIPRDAALVEFAIYRPLVKTATTMSSKLGEPRYVAYVIRNSGLAGSADLGLVSEIDAALLQFRVALRDPKRTDVWKLARDADQMVIAPVRQFLGDSKHLLISPDGELNLIPFEALVNERQRAVIEDYAVTYLTSGRDLARMQVARPSKSQSAVVANPEFGEPSSDGLVASVSQVRTAKASKRRSITNTRNLSDTYFAPLRGTSVEANSIKTLFPEVKLLTGAGATETAVKALAAPKILHIATHGFFLDDQNSGDDKKAAKSGLPIGTSKIENPLLRSGLAFAGANRRSGDKDDGILTALEASGLNLWGTKLVVLSACDTGLGEVSNGEGVYGLRRSFVLAGAESIVMSMWPVSDYVTRELMTNYYKNLKKGMGRGEALRQVQLEMIKRPNRRHPFYWASFIQSGEWANLDGNR